ncbi:MAG TPA: MFS transporter [Sporosarcina sp.]|nr:MFS transporter [Sporosarcina sp.]
MKKQSKFHYAWLILFALCIIVGLGKGGLNNTAGQFLPFVTDDLGIGMGKLSLYFSVSAVVTMLFLPIGGKLMAKYDTRLILVVGIVLQAGAFALFGAMSSVWGWYVLAVPLAVGGVFITVIAGPVIINQWFKKKNGLALGILSAAGGLLGAIVQPVAGNLIATQGWRFTYIALGVAVIAIVVPIVLFIIKRSPQAAGVQPLGADESLENEEVGQEDISTQGISMKIARKSTAFYALVVFFFLVTSIASFSMHIPQFLIDKGFDAAETGSVMGVYMIGVLVGSLIIGVLTDKIGSKITSIFVMAVGVLSVALLSIATLSSIVVVAVGLLGFISASIGTLGPSLASSLFGNKEYSQIYSTASLGLAISSIVAIPVYGFIYDTYQNYSIALIAIIAMLIINIVCVLIAFQSKNKLVKDGHWNSTVEE